MTTVLVTGSRGFIDAKLIVETLDALYAQHGPLFEVMHGACGTGADFVASEWVKWANGRYADIGVAQPRIRERDFPARDFGEWPVCGPIRNTHMVSLGPDICLGFFQMGAKNKGTTDCVTKALTAGIPIRTFWSS